MSERKPTDCELLEELQLKTEERLAARYEPDVQTDDRGLCVECGCSPAEHTRAGCPASALLVPDWD